MKNRILSISLRSIKSSFSRFLSLILMSFLGVFVFVGLKVTSPSMMKSLNSSYNEANVYDLKLQSNYGFSKNMNLPDLDYELIKSIDLICNYHDLNEACQIQSIPNKINKLTLIDGRYPISDDEVLVESVFLEKEGFHIGDKISFDSKDLIYKEYQIVGSIHSNYFINNDSAKKNRGKTNLGNGTLSYLFYLNESAFNFSYYKTLWITDSNLRNYETNSKKYLENLDILKNKVESYQNHLIESRKIEIEESINEAILNLKGEMTSLNQSYIQNEILKLEYEKENLNIKISIYDRLDYQEYKSFIDDTKSINNLSLIFPIVFFMVAILVSLVSMKRMVSEDRMLMGTLMSLGFSKFQILFKYLFFSLSATFIGGFIGAILGNIIIPNLIWSIYKILFNITIFKIKFSILNICIGFLIALVCIVGASIYEVLLKTKENPSSLLRPESPRAGKKILLERFSFLWNHLSFSKKVTIRNLFRYKKRAFVTIFGVLGCTALILCGYGIKNSIEDIPSKQYEEVLSYDGAAYLKENEDYEKAFHSLNITEFEAYSVKSVTVDKYDVSLFQMNNSSKFIHLENKKGKNISLKDGVVVTDKLASLLNLSEGDEIHFIYNEKTFNLKVDGITKYYIGHYLFINEEAYLNLGFDNIKTISYFNSSNDLNDELKNNLLNTGAFLNISFTNDLIEQANNMLESLNKVVIILILLSAILSMVVLYNLSNINICERRREIASLKVLGFYDHEVDHYITSENLILTLFGVLLGIGFGYFLTNIVIDTVEIEYVRFIHHIKCQSYLYSMLFSILFTLIINLISHFKLSKIDMIESLKSVE